MSAAIPESFRDLFTKKSFAHIATIMPDGSPHVVPVWVDIEGDTILVNSADGRRKDRNMQKHPQVALSITDPDNPYRMIAIRGRVVEFTDEGGRAHINKLSKKYTGRDVYPGPPTERRIIYRIQPEHVATMG